MLIYRDSATVRPAAELIAEIRAAVCSDPLGSSALTLAGVLESALADVSAPSSERARALTDLAASAWLGDRSAAGQALALLDTLPAADRLRIVRPEGFAFYALDPRAYAELARAFRQTTEGPVLVIGIRSIGTTLSAVVLAELARSGMPARRISVRPSGHPWDRALTWNAEERQLIRSLGRDAHAIVVDEGPGLSGSTFLAVGEALVDAGMPHERIRFFGSRMPDPHQLRARDGARRWSAFRMHTARGAAVPEGAMDVSGGRWRELTHGEPAAWPAVWAERERVKYWRDDPQELLKFAGFSPYGDAPLERAQAVAEAGFGPAVQGAEPGFVASRWLNARPLNVLDRELVTEVLPRYIAFRAQQFRVSPADCESLEEMTRVNVHEALGVELDGSFALEVRLPLIADGQLSPHEWLVDGDGAVFKTDAADHGDDHLFPGPCDVAWDVAGAIVEWELDPDEHPVAKEVEHLLGDRDLRQRLPAYLVAYTSFRAGVASFAQNSGTEEERERWRSRSRFYRARLKRAVSGLNR